MEFKTELKDFQKEAVEWMKSMNEKHQGGFNFMEPGLGKSICCINTIHEKDKVLIVCPAGLMYNWVNEIKKHTNLKSKDILLYHGQDRGGEKCKKCKKVLCIKCQNFEKKLKSKKIIITSYNIVANSKSKNNNLIFNKTYNKIFFDETHILRNKKGKLFSSACELKGDCKWCITATPIFNNYKEVYVYFKLIGYVENFQEWKELVYEKTKIKKIRKINNLVKVMSIKKEKSKVLTTLLPKVETDVIVKMSNFEREFYNCLKDYTLTRMKLLFDTFNMLKKENKNIKMLIMQNFLVYILRLRQACDSPMLVIEKMVRLKDSTDIKTAIQRLKFYNDSKNIKDVECPICYERETDCIISPCGHKYCSSCVDKIQECALCRVVITDVESTCNEHEANHELGSSDIKCSKKLQKVLSLINEKLAIDEKIVIVSQWLKPLSIIEEKLSEDKIKFTTLKGTQDMETRMSNINSFNNNKNIKVCLISMCASSEGINLTSANNMVLIDQWWNKSRMIQVVDRIHRIGQEKQVYIYNLITVNSIEEKIQDLVNKKNKLTSLVVSQWDIEDDDNYDESWMNKCIKLLE